MSELNLTLEQLGQILTGNQNVSDWYDALAQTLPEYDINTPERIAAFLAQCAHESGGFKTLKTIRNLKR